MSESVVLPALGESVTEGTVTRWLKKVGDSVNVDEPLVEVSTDKVDTEIPSPVAGVIEQILVQEDETVQVGAVLVIIGSGSGSAAPAAPAAAAASWPPAQCPQHRTAGPARQHRYPLRHWPARCAGMHPSRCRLARLGPKDRTPHPARSRLQPGARSS